MPGLEGVRRFKIAPSAFNHAYSFMADMGRKGHEGLALFVGTVQDEEALVSHAYIPSQKAIRTVNGLSLHLDSDALHLLNAQLHEHKLRLLAQIHSHGEHAYHSDTDDQYSIVTTAGGLSMVVPHFAAEAFDLGTCAAYRLHRDGWHELELAEKREQILITR